MHKDISRSIFTILLLMLLSIYSFAQQEIPVAIKDKILNGINYLENSKTPEDIDKAVKEFTEAAAMAPEYADVHYYLGKTLSLMQGNAGKAVKELKKYLELFPDAPDNVKVKDEIKELEEIINAKRKSSLLGAEFVKTSDGIFVRYVYPFSPANRQLKIGDKIAKLNRKAIINSSLHEFFKLVDDFRNNEIPATIIRGGNSIEIVINKSIKPIDENIKELGEEDLNGLITESEKPLVVVFWTIWCGPCIKYSLILKDLAKEYGNAITFISVSLDENKNIEKEFEIVQFPATHFYKNGELLGKIIGNNKDMIKEKITSLIY